MFILQWAKKLVHIHCKLSAQKAVALVLVLSTIQGLACPNPCQALYSGQNQDLTGCFLCPQFAVIGLIFCWVAGYTSGNKAKPLEIQYKKAYITIFVCAKYHKFILCLSISTHCTILQSQWTSFFAHTTFAQISWYHMTKPKILCHLTSYYIWDPLSAITPQTNVPSATQWNILTLLQKGESCYQVAFQMNVSCSTITGLYSNASSTAPRQPGGYWERLTPRVNTPSLEKLCLEWSLQCRHTKQTVSLSKCWLIAAH